MSSSVVSAWLSRPSRSAVAAASASAGDAARAPVERVPRVALERRRQPGARAAGRASPPAHRSAGGAHRPPRSPGDGGAHRSRTATSCSRSPRFDAVTPSSRTRIPRTSGRASSRAVGVDRPGQVGRLGQCPLAGDRPKAAVPDLDRDGPRPDAGRTEPPGHAVGHRQERPLDHLGIAGVHLERVLVPDRLRRIAVMDRVGIDPAGTIHQRRPVLAETADEQVRRERGEVADRPDAVLAQRDPPSCRRRPTAGRSAAARGRPPRHRPARRPARRACAGPTRPWPRAWWRRRRPRRSARPRPGCRP